MLAACACSLGSELVCSIVPRSDACSAVQAATHSVRLGTLPSACLLRLGTAGWCAFTALSYLQWLPSSSQLVIPALASCDQPA